MSTSSSNIFSVHNFVLRISATLTIAALLFSAVPAGSAVAQEAGEDGTPGETATTTEETTQEPEQQNEENNSTSTDESTTGETGTSTEETNENDGTDGSSGTSTEENAATSTDEGTATSTEENNTGTSTGDGTDGTDGSENTDGENGTTTATSTPPTGDGSEGPDGQDGADGNTPVTVEASPEDSGDPVPVISEHEIGEQGTPEDGEEVTGALTKSGGNITITTGSAGAHGELFSDVNSSDVRSEIDGNYTGDLDFYTFNATGTNDATVENTGAALALTGENGAFSRGVANITTGEAIAAFNVANVVNSNVVNSDGFLYLKNQVMETQQSLDLRDFFFPDPNGVLASAQNCTLLSCVAEDIIYNYAQTNHATVTNDINIEAASGYNIGEGEYVSIETGDAYGGVNVINVVNTNIVDSNYRFLAYNAIGDLEGDLMLPEEELFNAFFGRPNGVTQLALTEGETISANVLNDNDALVNNNINAYAETGLNNAFTSVNTTTATGRAESESNILNKINENTFGGDSMYLWIRIHGTWSGDVHGLPSGLTWEWTPDGIVIYNEDAEIAPSKLLRHSNGFPRDIDSYTANLESFNRATIDNNIRIDAVTGDNEITGTSGNIRTGDAFASANVINIANTNVIGTNWTFAVINIMGDFDGDVTFTETDLSLTGELTATDNPLKPGSVMHYTYTVRNNGERNATGVMLTQTLNKAYATGTNNVQEVPLGTIAKGASKKVTLTGFVDPALSVGTHTVSAVARVDANEADRNESDNAVLLSRSAVRETETGTGTTGNTTGTSTELETGTSTGDGSDTTGATSNDDNVGFKPSSGGGGGGGGGSKTKKIDREQKPIDPDAPPHLVVDKKADQHDDEMVVAGESVDYTVVITNNGGTAYDAVLYDRLTNPIGSVINEQSWELGTIKPGEVIKVEYTTEYNLRTPSGTYTNTASVEAYRHETSKKDGEKPLQLDEATHTIEIDGVPLAVGNVEPIAYFPALGNTGALITWQTNRPATGQVFYSPAYAGSVYNPILPNHGFQNSSVVFPEEKTTHYMILLNLTPGVKYSYRIKVTSGQLTAVGGDYSFMLPPLVSQLTLAFPAPHIAGAATNTPAPTPIPAGPATSAPQPVLASSPAPKPAPKPVLTQEPEPEPEPGAETEPEPTPAPESEENGGGFFQKAANTVKGFFGW